MFRQYWWDLSPLPLQWLLYFQNPIIREATLRGLNFADHSIREILTLSPGFNFADGPFRNILRISRMRLVQIFSQISRIDKAVLETEGWNKKNKNQLRNNDDFYVWEISQGLRFVSNKDCISLFKFFFKFRGLVLFFLFFLWEFNFADGALQIFRWDLISRIFRNPRNPRNLIPAKFNPLKSICCLQQNPFSKI